MRYKFEDIIYSVTTKKKPEEADKYNYIALEHIQSGSLEISHWGADVKPDGEKIVIKKGDVLFGKRRAYQKKVAISPIDGIFSAHGMALRPKEDVIDKDFLPFFISSDKFLNEAIRISVGGISPTINWKDIKELEFDLPPLPEQKRLAEKLWAAYEVKQSYLNMLSATDEMLKAQFLEMFGKSLKVSINDMVDTIWGSSPDSETYNDNGNGLPFYQGKTEFGDVYINDATVFCSKPIKVAYQNDILMSVRAPVGSVNIAKEKCCIGRGLASIVPKEGIAERLFVFHALRILEDEISRL